jgi:uncharacterized membrane protein YphA (DoxX/SURF4 family)
MKHLINSVSRYWRRRSVGLFFIRAVTGSVFFAHGWSALQAAPDMFAWLQIVGGIALFLGILPRIFGFVLGVYMLATIYMTGAGLGFKAHELELMLMASSFAIAFIGSGWISLFRLECALCGGMLCAKDQDCPKRPPG